MQKLLNEVLSRIKPTPQEEAQLKRTTESILKTLTIPHTESFPGGSGAKGTWLKGNHDIDIYIRFSKEHYADKDISKILGSHLAKYYKLTKLHGSRDYYQTEIDGIVVEFIPLFYITHPTDATNITDISPLHTLYVKKFKKPDEVRLFKAFCKAQNVYGAESYKQGLSGYVCEILVIHYGTFAKTIRAISTWKDITIIGKKKDVAQLNEAKTLSPLILIDPVDSYRNAAAAISKEQYDTLRKACKSFLKKPHMSFFIKTEITLQSVTKKHPKKKILAYTVTPLEAKKDVAGAKLRKGLEYLEQKLQHEGFTVIETYWTWNPGEHGTYYFVIDPKPLSYIQKHQGPPLSKPEAVEHFKKKWKKYPLKKTKTYVYIEAPRNYQLPEEHLKHILRTDKTLTNYLRAVKKLS